jgi:hypothetical protein
MVENAKNLSLELNEDDKEILDKVVLNYAVKFYALTQQYPSPKKYAEEYLLKAVNKDSNIAAVFTITYAMTSPHGQQIRPGELNQKLANNIQNAFKEQYIDVASQLQNNEFVKKFLSPHDLRMDVLKKQEDQGIFIHLTTEEEIRRQQDRRSHSYGRSSSTTIYNERGGRLSVYIYWPTTSSD